MRPTATERRFGAALLCGGLAGAGAAAEPTTVGDLERAFAASRAMEQGEPMASPYRAGRFDGYLAALAEALAGRGEVCLPACFCQVRERLDPGLERDLATPDVDRRQPAAPWLAGHLRTAFPCAPR